MIPDHDIEPNVISATIIDHQRHDETINDGKVHEYTKPNAICIIS